MVSIVAFPRCGPSLLPYLIRLRLILRRFHPIVIAHLIARARSCGINTHQSGSIPHNFHLGEEIMIRTVRATAAIVIGITAVVAQSEPIIKQRNGLMTSMWKEGF